MKKNKIDPVLSYASLLGLAVNYRVYVCVFYWFLVKLKRKNEKRLSRPLEEVTLNKKTKRSHKEI